MVKVIGGFYKGRKLKTIEGLKTRPTPSMVREAIFDIISEEIKGKNFLDLYAGFGCVGIEALSRGAKFCFFVENNFKTLSILKDNLEMLKLAGSYQILNMDALKSIKSILNFNLKFDFIFLDPPYSENPFLKFFNILLEEDILSNDGKVIVQHSKKNQITVPEGLILIKQYNYGDTSLTFVENEKGF